MGEAAPYRLELAKSDRSTCVASKEKIAKGEVRFGSLVMMGGSNGSYKWRKITHLTPKLLDNVDEKLGNYENIDGFMDLTAEQQMAVVAAFKLTREAAVKPKAKKEAAPKMKAEAKPKAKKAAKNKAPAEGADGSEVTPPGKKRKTDDVCKVEADMLEVAHSLISLARDASWDKLFELLARHSALVNERPAVREMSILHQAAYYGQLDVITRLVKDFGADPTLRTKHAKTAVEVAEEQGHAEAVALLKANLPAKGLGQHVVAPPAELDAEAEDRAHGLIDLARDGKWDELFAKLDEQRNLVNVRPAVRAYGILHQAAYHGDERALALLLDNYGADPTSRSKHEQLPVDIAVERGHVMAAEMLGSMAAASRTTLTPEKPQKGTAALSTALGPPRKASGPSASTCDDADDIDMVQKEDGTWMVVKKPQAGTSTSSSAASDSKTSEAVAHELITLARDGSWDDLFDLLSRHPDLVNVRPEVREYTILHQAVYHGCLDVVVRLIKEYGATVDSLSRTGKTPEDVARERGFDELLNYFCKASGAKACDDNDDIDMVQKEDGTWMVVAKPQASASASSSSSSAPKSSEAVAHELITLARDGHWDDLFDMLSRHPDLVNVRPEVREYSILHQAAFHGCLDVVVRLVEEYGAAADGESRTGKTPADVARERGFDELLDYFCKATGMADDGTDDYDFVQMPDGSWKVVAKSDIGKQPTA
mmetsp:Transcript_69717/g.130137  ORF Transcript_69717/g.130137 Transcript_69717/m.130137 type:complete len:710 (+) Transcript_69717:54-2183(+)